MFAISYTQLYRLLFLNVVNPVNVARRNDVIPRFYADFVDLSAVLNPLQSYVERDP